MGHPVFVVDIQPESNQVVIGENEDLFTTRVIAKDFNYMAVQKMESGDEFIGKIRYAHKGTKCKVVKTWEDKVEIEFDEPVRAITPGQNLVLYMGEYVAGGGVIIRG
jgi:tRNA-specific 2-thiouridylase